MVPRGEGYPIQKSTTPGNLTTISKMTRLPNTWWNRSQQEGTHDEHHWRHNTHWQSCRHNGRIEIVFSKCFGLAAYTYDDTTSCSLLWPYNPLTTTTLLRAVHVHRTTIQTTPTPVVQFNSDPFIVVAVGRSFLTVNYKLHLSHRLSWPRFTQSLREAPSNTANAVCDMTCHALIARRWTHSSASQFAPKELRTLYKLIHIPWAPSILLLDIPHGAQASTAAQRHPPSHPRSSSL